MFALLQATWGLKLSESSGEISFYRPVLPDFLDRLPLRNLRLYKGSADVLLHPHAPDVTVTQTRRHGDGTGVMPYGPSHRDRPSAHDDEPPPSILGLVSA